MMQMEEEGKYDYKIEFVGLFVLDEDFVLGEEKTIAMPITGEEVNFYIQTVKRDINISGDLCGGTWGGWVHDFHNQEG